MCFGMVWYGVLCYRVVWCDTIRYDIVRRGVVCFFAVCLKRFGVMAFRSSSKRRIIALTE